MFGIQYTAYAYRRTRAVASWGLHVVRCSLWRLHAPSVASPAAVRLQGHMESAQVANERERFGRHLQYAPDHAHAVYWCITHITTPQPKGDVSEVDFIVEVEDVCSSPQVGSDHISQVPGVMRESPLLVQREQKGIGDSIPLALMHTANIGVTVPDTVPVDTPSNEQPDIVSEQQRTAVHSPIHPEYSSESLRKHLSLLSLRYHLRKRWHLEPFQ